MMFGSFQEEISGRIRISVDEKKQKGAIYVDDAFRAGTR